MASKSVIDLSSFSVRNADGRVNETATLAKVASFVASYAAETETQLETIASAIHATFDRHLGNRLNMPSLINSALLVEMACPPEQLKVLTDRAQKYVRENASVKREDGKLFCITKGPLGGVARWADVPVPSEEK